MNNQITLQESLDYVRCPDCRGVLDLMSPGSGAGVICKNCSLAFPYFKGILIILDSGSRNASMEGPLIRNIITKARTDIERKACNKTLELLENIEAPSYAWEDEKHWSEVYEKYLQQQSEKNWNDRYWQRKPLLEPAVELLRQKGPTRPRLVLDIGCGEGQDFRQTLVPEFGPKDIYIGLDISFSGLVLNRAKNPHERSLYILGCADSPPLRDSLADVIICLGVLHHMKAKEKGLVLIANLLNDGLVVLSEPINGSFLPRHFCFARGARSVHDDFIDLEALKQSVAAKGLTVIYERQHSGLIYILLMKMFRRLLLRSEILHGLAHEVDDFVAERLGKRFSIFRSRGLSLAVAKHPYLGHLR